MTNEELKKIKTFFKNRSSYFVYENVMFSYTEFSPNLSAHIWYPKRSKIKWNYLLSRYVLKKVNKKDPEPYFVLVWDSEKKFYHKNAPWERAVQIGLNEILAIGQEKINKLENKERAELDKLVKDWTS